MVAAAMVLAELPYPASARPCLLSHPNARFTETALQLPGVTEHQSITGVSPSIGGLALSQDIIPRPGRHSAEEAFNKGDYRQAKRLAEEWLSRELWNPDAQWLLARTLFELDSFPECLTACEAISNTRTDVLDLKSRALFMLGYTDRASNLAKMTFQLDRQSSRGPLLLAELAYQFNNTEVARNWLTQFLGIPTDKVERVTLALQVALRRQDAVFASEVLGRERPHLPEEASMLIQARIELAKVRITNAIDNAKKAVVTRPSVEGYLILGKAHSQKHNNEAALSAFTNAIQLAPMNSDALRERAQIYLRLGNTALAFKDAVAAMRIVPMRTSNWRYLKHVLASAWVDAEEAPPELAPEDAADDIIHGLEKTLRIKPDDDLSRHHAFLLALHGRHEEAVEKIESILQLAPSEIVTLRCAFWIYERAGFPGRAFTTLGIVLEKEACDLIAVLRGVVDAAMNSGKRANLRQAKQLIQQQLRPLALKHSTHSVIHTFEGLLELADANIDGATYFKNQAFRFDRESWRADVLEVLIRIALGDYWVAHNILNHHAFRKAQSYFAKSQVSMTRAMVFLAQGNFHAALNDVNNAFITSTLRRPDYYVTFIRVLMGLNDQNAAQQAAENASRRFPLFASSFRAA